MKTPLRSWRSGGAALLCVLLSFAAAETRAADEPRVALAHQDGEARVNASLWVHPDDAGSRSVRAGVLLEIEPGWHVYGAEAGETGIPTEIAWAADGGRVSALAWPPTAPFGDEELGYEGMGYSGRVLLPARVRFDAAPGALHADVSLLACKDECIPAEAQLVRAPATFAAYGPAAERTRAPLRRSQDAREVDGRRSGSPSLAGCC